MTFDTWLGHLTAVSWLQRLCFGPILYQGDSRRVTLGERVEMQLPRSAGALGKEFPYTDPTVCYIEVRKDGEVGWGKDDGVYGRLQSGESRLYAVWPGKWSSHLFVIDDLTQYAGAMGIIHDEERTGFADHDHVVRWSVSQYEQSPNSSYIAIGVNLDCGCDIKDLKAFARQMKRQKGWDVATSTGWSSGGPVDGPRTYSITVRRKSLTVQGASPKDH